MNEDNAAGTSVNAKLYKTEMAIAAVSAFISTEVWSCVVRGAEYSHEIVEDRIRTIAGEHRVPYEHLCRLASVVREIYRARVEGAKL